jgi:hypothetical protein
MAQADVNQQRQQGSGSKEKCWQQAASNPQKAAGRRVRANPKKYWAKEHMGSKRAAALKHGKEEEEEGSLTRHTLCMQDRDAGNAGKAVCHV